MNYIIAIFFIFIGLLVLTIQNKHFKAAYSFAFLSGIGFLLYSECSFNGIEITLLSRTFDVWQILQAFALGLFLPVLFEIIIWFIFRKKPKEKIGLDYDLTTGVISFLHFGGSIFVGHLLASWIGVFAIGVAYLLVYTFLRVFIKHVKLIGTERNNSLAVIALLPLVAFNAGFQNISIFDGNVLLGFFSGALFVLINLVAGLLTEKLSTKYFVLFISIGLFVAGGFGMKIKENFGGIETLVAGMYSLLIVIAFARSFGNPLRLINFNFNSLIFLFTGTLLLIAPFISKPDLSLGKEVTQGVIRDIEKEVIETKDGKTISFLIIENEAKGNWIIKKETSSLNFEVGSQGKPTLGRFDEFTGTIQIDSLLEKSSISFEVDVESINTFKKSRDEHLRESDYFDVEKYPKASFTSSSIFFRDTAYVATGVFKMKGIEKEMEINFSLKHTGKTEDKQDFAVFKGGFQFDRTQFGMTHENAIEDLVTITFELEGRKK